MITIAVNGTGVRYSLVVPQGVPDLQEAQVVRGLDAVDKKLLRRC